MHCGMARRLLEEDQLYLQQKGVSHSFQVGDLVLCRAQAMGIMNLASKWEGPIKLIQKLSSRAHYLEDVGGKALKRSWNAFNLRSYFT